MKTTIIFLLTMCFATVSLGKLKVVTTTTDLKALVSAVGGDFVEVTSVAKGTQDPHQIEAKPSFMVQMRSADLAISQGLELESAWLIPLVQGARNPKINPGGKGFLELGESLDPIDVPKGSVSRAEGDVHPGGNPHFQLDPIRMGKAAVLVANRLLELDPANAEAYKAAAAKFEKHLQERTTEWKARLVKAGVKEIVTYHKTLSYFLDRFEIKGGLQLEPKPGIPPTASHLVEVIEQMKRRGVRVVLIENFYSTEAAGKLKKEVPGLQVYRVPVSVEGEPGVHSTEDLIELIVTDIESAK